MTASKALCPLEYRILARITAKPEPGLNCVSLWAFKVNIKLFGGGMAIIACLVRKFVQYLGYWPFIP